jgi:SAM-dependent methyltransferase
MNDTTSQNGYARRSKFYRVEYNEKRDIPFFLSFIEQDISEVLEVPCGAGRLTIELAKKAGHVTAIDIESPMITSLQQFAAQEGLTSKITAQVGDMTDLRLDRKFDVIIVPSEALQLLSKEQGKKAYSCLVGHLRDAGTLIIDIATFRETLKGQPDYFDPETIGTQWHKQWTRPLPDEGSLTRLVRVEKDEEKTCFEFQYKLKESGTPDISFTEKMMLYSYDVAWFFNEMPASVNSICVRSSYDGLGDLSNPQRFIVVICKKTAG